MTERPRMTLNQLRYLPFQSQCDLALVLAAEIDRGDKSKPLQLERLFIAIQYFQRGSRA